MFIESAIIAIDHKSKQDTNNQYYVKTEMTKPVI